MSNRISAGIFGLIGALLTFIYMYKMFRNLLPPDDVIVAILLGFNVFYCLLSGAVCFFAANAMFGNASKSNAEFDWNVARIVFIASALLMYYSTISTVESDEGYGMIEIIIIPIISFIISQVIFFVLRIGDRIVNPSTRD